MPHMTSVRYTHVGEVVDATLCPKPDNSEYYRRNALNVHAMSME